MFVIGNHFSVTFAGNTRSLPKKEASERSSNWVGSGLAVIVKFKTRLERVSKGKPSSLLGLIISEEGKKFYNIDTWKKYAYKLKKVS